MSVNGRGNAPVCRPAGDRGFSRFDSAVPFRPAGHDNRDIRNGLRGRGIFPPPAGMAVSVAGTVRRDWLTARNDKPPDKSAKGKGRG